MPKSVVEKVDLADRIAQDIQAGVFSAGSWLKQIDLQERYDATRLEVRRALDQLASTRVVSHIPNRGYHVFERDAARDDQVRDIRKLLEVAAVEDLMPHVTKAKLAELRGLAERFQGLLSSGTLLELYDVNMAFHTAMYNMCRNRELVALIYELRKRGPAAPAREWVTHQRIVQSAKEHFDIVDAMEARDLKRVQKAIRAHVGQDIS
ncbi:GntR family transcriptional regulator [Bordetella sp. BOR01]|uniref:GntR family transcriptional regulator n=1 Tax=Bordetella sp. BOR01 TaxID=2854779 RepID=UPI001C48CA64|nr:GntR family transcriptional regulator [Bordetella sp. BOR01]MBV7481406.1 GntR family transcriptional regulator [Bordetella sp. BOR01]